MTRRCRCWLMELAAEPFTEKDQNWLKATIDVRQRGSGGPQYTGWYCDLFYKGGLRASDWAPTVVDVHTDPNTQEVLEQGVGNCNFLVVAIDNEEDRAIYVGPAYSYYEFTHPAADRQTDEAWKEMPALCVRGFVPIVACYATNTNDPRPSKIAHVPS